jgi:hypothetical protein
MRCRRRGAKFVVFAAFFARRALILELFKALLSAGFPVLFYSFKSQRNPVSLQQKSSVAAGL